MDLAHFLSDNFVPRIPPKKTSNRHDAAKLLGKTEDQESTASLQSSTMAIDTALDRKLRGRHVQLLGIGATIGLALFVSIGLGLARGGPLNLLLAFILWSFPILFITISTAEMVTYLPITSPFVCMAGRCCDLALEVMTAWNFWFLCSAQIPFEIITVSSILKYWRSDFSVAIPVSVQMVVYFVIAVFRVSVFGEVEFWLSLGKVIMAVGLIFFTFITMVGGNPKHWAFGFIYWQNPGPMNVFHSTGNLGRFEGFLACLIRATFMFSGPEYVSLVASETINPRKTLPSAYKQVFTRLTVFFIGGALCVGILVPYNDPTLQNTAGVTLPGAAGSPYVIAMQNLGISVMPDIVNALLISSAFSAGNSYTYCSSRTLYGFASNGYAPHFLTATTKTEVPIYCMIVALLWALIAFLQLNDDTAKVLNWIIGFITSCQLINFSSICLTYVFFYRALKAQGIDRNTFPFVGWYQPWLAIIGGALAFVMIFVGTYTMFLPGQWNYRSFLFSYLMIFVDIGIFVLYKLFARTKWRKAEEVDLTTGLKEVEEHEKMFYRQLKEEGKMNEEGRIKRTFAQRFFTVIFGSEIK
ncbi:hypothetical protein METBISCDRAFT_23766 [Metschnikowia bicuspidata]|uniref:Amino acid permease/ SLC12A domain-containing protein n=1 Tax=Metschnikowia bicuspidata TaxID=27322 RepID=A0A4P9ZAZ0_9ASCO|nr:hypothetical protein METBISCDRAFT_23766 [Metschnikowia bicuspidata]